MSKETQILQLRSKGFSQRNIADALKVSRNTVAKVFRAADSNPISESTMAEMDEAQIHFHLFPEDVKIPVLATPDFPYIHKEMLKSGVTLKLLWEEYVDSCRRSKQPPYMYSQYCKLYQD